MNLTVNQGNLYLFLPSKVSRMAEMLSKDRGLSITEAMKAIYLSETYRRLEREDSKAWHEGPVALYESFVNASAGSSPAGSPPTR